MQAMIKAPEDCSHEELSTFERLILEAGEVEPGGLLRRIKSAHKLIFIEIENECVSVGAIKIPSEDYKNRVFLKAGVADEKVNYQYELGYLYTLPDFRGHGAGSLLMESACEALHGDSCFATAREENTKVHHLFSKASFLRLGQVYQSDRGNYYLGLFATKPK